MGSISDHLENELLDHIFNAAYTPATTVFVGLSTADPLDTEAGLAEPSGNGYERKPLTFNAASSRSIDNSAQITFPQASGSWGELTHYAIFDAASDGNMLAHGSLSVAKTVSSGNTPSIGAGEIVISFKTLGSKTDGTNNISDYLANKLLDFAFRNQSFDQPDTYVALCSANIADDDTGSTIAETSGNGYERKQVNVNGGASPTWDLAASGVVDNTHDIEFATPATGGWSVVTAIAIVDASTAGNLLTFDNDISEETPAQDDTVKIEAGNCDITLT